MSHLNILQAVILVSEKAANIARAIRYEEHLLSLLVREKKDNEKNPRFVHDFKTLADVLVQEVVKHDLGSEFPDLVGHIYGEESNEFSCLNGECIHLSVGDTEENTYSQLLSILGDERAAHSLGQLVHAKADVQLVVPPCNLQTDEIGIWIDPIDSTAEYIAGGTMESEVSGVYSSGLPCVTVLIGAFHRQTGQPVLGIINQPFNQQQGDRWIGKIIWGVNHGDLRLSSLTDSLADNKIIVVSSSESDDVKDRLRIGGYQLLEAAGAGYKLLCVALGLVSGYVLSRPSTYYWDTCGPHGVLSAAGGGVVSYQDHQALSYCGGQGTDQCCNTAGLIAYSDQSTLNHIIELLSVPS